MPLLIILALAIALLAVLFALQNKAIVTISFFIWTFNQPLAVVILSTLGIGVLVGLLVSVPAILRRNWRISRQVTQINSLESQIQTHQTEVSAIAAAHQQELDRTRQSHQALLSALSIVEPQTGLLSHTTAAQAASYLLQQSVQKPELQSVCAYVIEQNELQETTVPQDQILRQGILRAIATRLQACATPTSWLHSDGSGRLICLTPGLNPKSALDYGEKMRAALSDTPLTLENGATLPSNISIGGAIAESAEHLEGSQLIDQAVQALQNAKQRGQNRFRLEQVTR
ncbi:MAG: DUF1049 domain-containing protein [Synechococcales cyanobacterium T60_A2020_003]|nr:DUF1049 domain-containing protein [Synechococcales cyanobacterium T60_A2020_003]